MGKRYLVLMVLGVLSALGTAAWAAEPFEQMTADGLVVIETEAFHDNVSQGGKTWTLVTAPAGFSGTGAMQSLPDSGTNNNANYVTSSPRLDYQINFKKAGVHYVWVRGHAQGSGSNDSLHSGLDGKVVDTADRIALNSTSNWLWAGTDMDSGRVTINVPSPGVHTFNLWMREDGSIVDKIVLTTNASLTITGLGPSEQATVPAPANGEVGVTVPLLGWQPGFTSVWSRVYFGTTPDLGAGNLVADQVMAPMYYHIAGFEPGVTYYWRIDGVEGDLTTVHQGDVWSFTAEPLTAYVPQPADDATGQLPGLILTWRLGREGAGSRVYFGADQAAVAAGDAAVDKGPATETSFNTGALRASTTYFWRVDLVKADNSVVPGSVWSFTTLDGGPTGKILREWWSGISGTAITDLTGNARYPTQPSGSEYVNEFEGPVDWADNYGTRFYGWLKPPETGDYTFWISGDDAQELWLSPDESPSNAEIVARVSGWTASREWTKEPGQKSAPISLKTGQKYFIMALGKEGGGGDSTAVAWQGGSITAQAIIKAEYVDMVALLPLQAFGPTPANRAVDTDQAPVLTWNAGERATKHSIYFGDDQAAVAAADAASGLFKGTQSGTSFDPGNLEWNKTYFWRVDETDGTETWKGGVWSFTTANFIPVDDFESYNDDENAGTRIYETWIDGYADASSGSTVGNLNPPFAERAIVHSGKQSMPMDYNNLNAPFFSEAYRAFAPLQNWTVNGVTDLSLWVRGRQAALDPVVETGGKMTVRGEGSDIWNNSDQFTYVYKTLNGDGSLIARVTSNGTGTDTWSKGGVMIRDSLEGGSTHAIMAMTGGGGNGASFQYRAVADSASGNADAAAAITLPYYVKIERTGSSLSGAMSADGKTWTPLGTAQFIDMPAPTYIGIAVSSHVAGAYRTWEFDNVKATGASGSWQTKEIGLARNTTQPLYAVVEDSAGKKATVVDPNTAHVTSTRWSEWKIPLTDLQGVNLAKVKKLTVGVGDKANAAADGTGRIFIDDIRVTKPVGQ